MKSEQKAPMMLVIEAGLTVRLACLRYSSSEGVKYFHSLAKCEVLSSTLASFLLLAVAERDLSTADVASFSEVIIALL